MGKMKSLVTAASCGDADAANVVLQWAEPRVRAIVHARWPSDVDHVLAADDVVQDVLTEILLQLPRVDYQGEAAFATWVGVVTRTRTASAFRTVARRQRLGVGGHGSCDAVTANRRAGWRSHTSLVRLGEREAALRDALVALAPTQRWTVVARFLHGRSNADVADELGRSTAAVTMLTTRALTKLRSLMPVKA